MLETVALGLLSGCPLNNNKWFDRHSLAKNKTRKETQNEPKRKKKLYKYVFSLRDQGTPASALCTYCTREEWRTCAKKQQWEKLTHYLKLFIKDLLCYFAFWNVGTQTAMLFLSLKLKTHISTMAHSMK
jgi:hypothetical protein